MDTAQLEAVTKRRAFPIKHVPYRHGVRDVDQAKEDCFAPHCAPEQQGVLQSLDRCRLMHPLPPRIASDYFLSGHQCFALPYFE